MDKKRLIELVSNDEELQAKYVTKERETTVLFQERPQATAKNKDGDLLLGVNDHDLCGSPCLDEGYQTLQDMICEVDCSPCDGFGVCPCYENYEIPNPDDCPCDGTGFIDAGCGCDGVPFCSCDGQAFNVNPCSQYNDCVCDTSCVDSNAQNMDLPCSCDRCDSCDGNSDLPPCTGCDNGCDSCDGNSDLPPCTGCDNGCDSCDGSNCPLYCPSNCICNQQFDVPCPSDVPPTGCTCDECDSCDETYCTGCDSCDSCDGYCSTYCPTYCPGYTTGKYSWLAAVSIMASGTVGTAVYPITSAMTRYVDLSNYTSVSQIASLVGINETGVTGGWQRKEIKVSDGRDVLCYWVSGLGQTTQGVDYLDGSYFYVQGHKPTTGDTRIYISTGTSVPFRVTNAQLINSPYRINAIVTQNNYSVIIPQTETGTIQQALSAVSYTDVYPFAYYSSQKYYQSTNTAATNTIAMGRLYFYLPEAAPVALNCTATIYFDSGVGGLSKLDTALTNASPYNQTGNLFYLLTGNVISLSRKVEYGEVSAGLHFIDMIFQNTRSAVNLSRFLRVSPSFGEVTGKAHYKVYFGPPVNASGMTGKSGRCSIYSSANTTMSEVLVSREGSSLMMGTCFANEELSVAPFSDYRLATTRILKDWARPFSGEVIEILTNPSHGGLTQGSIYNKGVSCTTVNGYIAPEYLTVDDDGVDEDGWYDRDALYPMINNLNPGFTAFRACSGKPINYMELKVKVKSRANYGNKNIGWVTLYDQDSNPHTTTIRGNQTSPMTITLTLSAVTWTQVQQARGSGWGNYEAEKRFGIDIGAFADYNGNNGAVDVYGASLFAYFGINREFTEPNYLVWDDEKGLNQKPIYPPSKKQTRLHDITYLDGTPECGTYNKLTS